MQGRGDFREERETERGEGRRVIHRGEWGDFRRERPSKIHVIASNAHIGYLHLVDICMRMCEPSL